MKPVTPPPIVRATARPVERAAPWAVGLYRLGVGAYALAIRLAAPFHDKARRLRAGQRRAWRDLAALADGTAPVVWMHCASLGEFEQGRPVLEALRRTHPGCRALVTFFSPSGYEVRKNYAGADVVTYLPFDNPAAARRLLDLVRPRLALFVKYEFWYYYLRALRARGVPTLLVSGAFRPGQVFFRPYGGFFRALLRTFAHLFLQDERSAALLRAAGVGPLTVAGDTRYDRVSATVAQAAEVPLAAHFKGARPLLVVGSCWPEDTRVLVPFLNEQRGALRVIVAPHEIKEPFLREIERELAGRTVRFSRATPDAVAVADVLLIDNVGLLAALYRYGDYAFVGGGYRTGLHNILEAAAFGMPIIFGDRLHANYPEAVGLTAAGAAFPVADTAALRAAFAPLQTDEAHRRAVAARAAAFVRDRTGATQTIVRHVEQIWPKD